MKTEIKEQLKNAFESKTEEEIREMIENARAYELLPLCDT